MLLIAIDRQRAGENRDGGGGWGEGRRRGMYGRDLGRDPVHVTKRQAGVRGKLVGANYRGSMVHWRGTCVGVFKRPGGEVLSSTPAPIAATSKYKFYTETRKGFAENATGIEEISRESGETRPSVVD